jgi:hypothetical protein
MELQRKALDGPSLPKSLNCLFVRSYCENHLLRNMNCWLHIGHERTRLRSRKWHNE